MASEFSLKPAYAEPTSPVNSYSVYHIVAMMQQDEQNAINITRWVYGKKQLEQLRTQGDNQSSPSDH